MEKKKGFWRKAYQKSLQETREQLPVKWDAIRIVIAVIWTALAIGLSVVFGILRGSETAISILLSLFGGELALLFALWVSTPIIAFLKLPSVAERVAEEKDKEIQEQKDLVAFLKGRERLARVELIELRATKRGTDACIEIYNGEEGNPISCKLFVTEISGRGKINAMALGNPNGLYILPKTTYTIALVEWYEIGKTASLNVQGASDRSMIYAGEYIIKTHFEGSFYYPPEVVEKTDTWKLVFIREEKYLELQKLNVEKE